MHVGRLLKRRLAPLSISESEYLLRHRLDYAAADLFTRLSARLRDQIIFALMDHQYASIDAVCAGKCDVLGNAGVISRPVLPGNHVT